MTKHEAIEVLEEVKMLDDSMFAYSQAYNDALDIAIEALKAQEPRVMTLEEALGGNECWIEGRSVACGYGDAVLTCDGERVDFYRPHSVYILDFYEYGLSWRCWTSKPTDGQRKAVKWE